MNVVVFSGPESTAKTSLADAAGQRFALPVVAEVARTYLNRQSTYLPGDLRQIAHLQMQQEAAAACTAERTLLVDTDLQVIRIWWRYRYGALPRWLLDLSREQLHLHRRFYLICRPDVPWQEDPLRENPSDRDRLFQHYLADARAWDLEYTVISGQGKARDELAMAKIKDMEQH